MGFYYRELDRFATKSQNLSWIRSAKEYSLSQTSGISSGKIKKSSVYRRAIANGIVEILSVYRSAVLQIEQNLLSEPMPILATVTQGLNKVFSYYFLLEHFELYSLIIMMIFVIYASLFRGCRSVTCYFNMEYNLTFCPHLVCCTELLSIDVLKSTYNGVLNIF